MSLELVNITENLAMVVGANEGRFPNAHSFLVQDEVCALIDAGCGHSILNEIKRTYRVDFVINSHCHPDHINGNWLLSDVPLFAPRFGVGTHGRLKAMSHRFFGPGPLADYWCGWIGKVTGFRDRAATDYYDDGHVFNFGKLKLTAVHTPGHTKDHHCFFEPEHGILLSFDIDLTPFGPWYGNLESNLAEFRKSIGITRCLDARVVASSHTAVMSEDLQALFDRYAKVLDNRRETLIALLRTGATRSRLIEAAPIYGYFPYEPDLLRYFEGRMIDLHLEELASEGVVRKDGEEYCLV